MDHDQNENTLHDQFLTVIFLVMLESEHLIVCKDCDRHENLKIDIK
jgi:hypothetical protein